MTKETKIYSVFPGMGKTTIFENAAEAGITVADSDSSHFSWVVDMGTKIRNPQFPANYVNHIKDTIGTVDYLFVSTHKEVIEALIAEGIEFTIVKPSRELKSEYLRRYKLRNSPQGFIDLMDLKWESFMNDLDSYENIPKITVHESNQTLAGVLDISFKLEDGTPGIYFISESTELTEIIKSYSCYKHHDGVNSICYIGDWNSLISVDPEPNLSSHKFVFIKHNFDAVKYVKSKGLTAKILYQGLHNTREDARNHDGRIEFNSIYNLPIYRIDSLTSFIQVNYPKVNEYKMIINPNDLLHALDSFYLSPCIDIHKGEFKRNSFQAYESLAKGATKVLYVLDASNFNEEDMTTIGILYGIKGKDFGVLLGSNTPSKRLVEALDLLRKFFGDGIIYNETGAMEFMAGWK